MATIQKTLDINAPMEREFNLLTDPQRRRSREEVIRVRPTRLRSLFTCALIVLLLSGLALLLGPGPHALAAAEGQSAGHVYVLNNDLSGSNSITVFDRSADGSLTLRGTTSIGGLGSLTAFGTTNAGTQGSLILTGDRTRLFAVD